MQTHITIAIGADHRGVDYKNHLKTHHECAALHISWIDVGCHSTERCDYPPFSYAVVHEMKTGAAQRGVLICGSGVGMAIAANRFEGIYAALAWNEQVAWQSRAHDNANVLVIPADYITHNELIIIFKKWISTEFLAGHYQHRIEQINAWGGL